MILEVWISTDKVGSTCSTTIEVPDEDLEEYARDVIWNMAEWGFREVEDV